LYIKPNLYNKFYKLDKFLASFGSYDFSHLQQRPRRPTKYNNEYESNIPMRLRLRVIIMSPRTYTQSTEIVLFEILFHSTRSLHKTYRDAQF